jgi:cysteine protease ATG4
VRLVLFLTSYMSLSLFRTLVSSFLECGLVVSVASDSTLYQTCVVAASHGGMNVRSPRRRHAGTSPTTTWGDRAVLLLLGIQLGIEGVVRVSLGLV